VSALWGTRTRIRRLKSRHPSHDENDDKGPQTRSKRIILRNSCWLEAVSRQPSAVSRQPSAAARKKEDDVHAPSRRATAGWLSSHESSPSTPHSGHSLATSLSRPCIVATGSRARGWLTGTSETTLISTGSHDTFHKIQTLSTPNWSIGNALNSVVRACHAPNLATPCT
jgi:hypothetical protein